MIIKTGNESKIELKEGLNEENKKSRSLQKNQRRKQRRSTYIEI